MDETVTVTSIIVNANSHLNFQRMTGMEAQNAMRRRRDSRDREINDSA